MLLKDKVRKHCGGSGDIALMTKPKNPPLLNLLLTDTFTIVVEVVATLTHGAGQRISVILPQIDADGTVVEHIFAIYKIIQ